MSVRGNLLNASKGCFGYGWGWYTAAKLSFSKKDDFHNENAKKEDFYFKTTVGYAVNIVLLAGTFKSEEIMIEISCVLLQFYLGLDRKMNTL